MRRLFVVAVIASLGLASSAEADRISLYVAADDVATYTTQDPGLGNYYVLRLQVPEAAKQGGLEHAYLELYLDVVSREIDGYREETPLLEVYALAQEFSGQLGPALFVAQTVPTVRNVVIGENRRVLVDITEIVRAYIKDPTTNHGLIIGSLTGRRDGLFTVKAGSFAEPSMAKITFFTR